VEHQRSPGSIGCNQQTTAVLDAATTTATSSKGAAPSLTARNRTQFLYLSGNIAGESRRSSHPAPPSETRADRTRSLWQCLSDAMHERKGRVDSAIAPRSSSSSSPFRAPPQHRAWAAGNRETVHVPAIHPTVCALLRPHADADRSLVETPPRLRIHDPELTGSSDASRSGMVRPRIDTTSYWAAPRHALRNFRIRQHQCRGWRAPGDKTVRAPSADLKEAPPQREAVNRSDSPVPSPSAAWPSHSNDHPLRIVFQVDNNKSFRFGYSKMLLTLG
jgi:hypothetical protein